MAAVPGDVVEVEAQASSHPDGAQEVRVGGTLRRFVGWFLEHVPDDKFDMQEWLNITVKHPDDADAGQLTYHDIKEAEWRPSKTVTSTSSCAEIRDGGVRKLASDDTFSCVTSGCLAGWVVMWDATVNGGNPFGDIEWAAAQILADGNRLAELELHDGVWYDFSLETPRQAAERLLRVADCHGL